jgi:transcriptional regulator with XRE-family HTH domain
MIDNSDDIVRIIGKNLKHLRLRSNFTQKQLADLIGKSRTAIERAEKGHCKLATMVSILSALNAEHLLDSLMQEDSPSPIALSKSRGGQRKRASGKDHSKDKDDLEW